MNQQATRLPPGFCQATEKPLRKKPGPIRPARTACLPFGESDAEAHTAARVVQLDEHPGAVFVHRLHETPETLEISSVASGDLTGFARAGAIHDTADPTEDEPDATARACLIEGDDVVVNAAAWR